MTRFFLPLSLLISCLLLHSAGFGQGYTIRGHVSDTSANRPLGMSAVLLVGPDSVLESHVRADGQGNFVLYPKKAARYTVSVYFPGFLDFSDTVSTVGKSEADMGEINMIPQERLLQEVVLTAQVSAIRVKGDTTEYTADSFKTTKNANVEDLLKKLPGIHVDRNGKITAQGEKVEKILVDGEEFFSDDPAMVTKNLQAVTVDKVQVFDKKSDQATFTGIDDGKTVKTVNLKLKDAYKKGFFGKIKAGGGTDGYYENQGLVNAFKGNRKLAVFGINSNTSAVGLSWDDRRAFDSDNDDMVVTEDGYTVTSNSDDELADSWNGRYEGEGLPTVWSGGVHFSDRWNDGKSHAGLNYRYTKQNIAIEGSTITEYKAAGNTFHTDKYNNSFSSAERHGGDGIYEWKPDSANTIRLRASASTSTLRSYTVNRSDTYDSSDARVNDSRTSLDNSVTGKRSDITLSFRHKFKKAGRTLTVNAEDKIQQNDGVGLFHSLTDLYGDTAKRVIQFDQKKTNVTNTMAFAGAVTYTEPIVKDRLFLSVRYAAELNNSKSARLSYNRGTGESYDSLSIPNSSNYAFDVQLQKAGTDLRFTNQKLNISAGGDVSTTDFVQHDLLRNIDTRRNFLNFFPSASIKLKIKKQENLRLNYNGATRQPTIEQVQPFQQNLDPLNVAVGNPLLRQEFNHSFNLSYNNNKVISSRYLYTGGRASFTQDAITTSQRFNDAGARTYQYINLDGNYSLSAYSYYNFKMKAETYVNIGSNLSQQRINSIINDVRNVSDNTSLTLETGVYKSKENKWTLQVSLDGSYNWNTATVSSYNTNYWSAHGSFDGTWQFAKHWEANTVVNVNLRQRTEIFSQNNSRVLWNAYVSRKFLKTEKLELRASVNDILNQNIGYSRSGQGNVITQESYATIRRYGLLSLVWNFTYSPAAAQATAE